MKKSNKIIFATVIGAALAGLAFTGTSLASHGNGFGFGNHSGSQTPPTAAEGAAHEVEMKTKLTDNLTKATTDGKLTDSQKTHILGVMDQIHTKMEANDRAGADKLRDELRAWIASEKIDSSVMPFGNGRGQGPRDGKGPRGQHNS